MKGQKPTTSSDQSVGVCQSISAVLWPSFIVGESLILFSFRFLIPQKWRPVEVVKHFLQSPYIQSVFLVFGR